MAIGDKKSLLQPSSTQSQQFRLQFTNLQPTSLTAQQLSPVANARPAVSVFLNAPAPVSLQAPPTIPPALPAPVPAPTPVVSNVPIVYSDTAFYFDGNSLFSSSLETIDFGFTLTSSDGFGIMMAIKPTIWVTGSTQTIVHMYSGSFASQSLNISLVNGAIQTTFQNNGEVVTLSRTVPDPSSINTLGNGYALVTFGYYFDGRYLPTMFFNKANADGTESMEYTNQNPLTSLSASFTSMDHLYIGGTKFESGKNFVGNIGFIAFSRNFPIGKTIANNIFNQINTVGGRGPFRPKDLKYAGVLNTRVYTFGEPNGNAFAVETTGSLMTKQVVMQFSGSSIYPNANYSYFTQ